jgi:hypothetical protein
MATQVLDQSVAFSEATTFIPASLIDPLRAHITGGHAKLFRYDDAEEKALVSLGAYNKDADTNYAWPAVPSGSLVDVGYAQLYADNAKLRYYQDSIGSGDTIAPVVNYPNRVRAAATRWKTNAVAARSAALLDRDVTVGDAVYLSNGTVELNTTVTGLVPEVVAASIAAATSGAGNAATQSPLTSSITQVAGTVNDVVAARNVNAYNALKDGAINEVYTITVIQAASTPGDATTARLSVTSSSGLDNQTSVTPSAYGKPTAIGTRRALVTFSHTASDLVLGQQWTLTIAQAFTAVTAASSGTYTGTQNLTYVATVTRGGFAGATNPAADPSVAATATATGGGATGGLLPAGTYYIQYTFVTTEGETTVGTSQSAQLTVGATNIPRVTFPALPFGVVGINLYLTDTNGAVLTERLYARHITTTTYDMAVATYDGGTFANAATPPSSSTATVITPLVTAVSTTGTDSSGPTSVPGSGAVAVGSFGVILTLSATRVRAGDTYLVTATAATDGAIQTIKLADNMPSALTAASDLTLRLYIEKDMAVPEEKLESAPNVNWSTTTTQLTVKAGATAFDSTWTSGGVQQALPMESGDLYIQYRAWLPTYAGKVTSISDRDDLENLLGVEHPDNPLSYAVGKALLNSNGGAVRFTAVADPTDTDEWDEVLTILDRLEDVYGLVPLTNDEEIIESWVTHADEQSTDDLSHPRVVWSALHSEATAVLIDATTTSDLAPAMGTLADNPAQSGTQYTLLTCTTANAKFVTKGVRAGDTVRFLYAIDGFGNTTYSSFVVASVTNEDALILQTGHTAAVTVAQRFEIWRNRTRTEQAAALATQITAGANQRWLPVFPGTMLDGADSVEGYYLCAALAGLASAVAPHQSLRHLSVSGFTAVGDVFNNGQLNTLEAAGCFTIDADTEGTLYVRRARTSDQTSIEVGEESAVRLLDTARLAFATEVRRLFGQSNVVPGDDSLGAAAVVRATITDKITLMLGTQVERLGPMLLDGTKLDSIRASIVSPDALVVQTTVVRPFALGAVTIIITVGVES